MADQDAFRALPPEIRAMALAGHYLQSFALMESALNSTIGAALKLDGIQTLIVCKNIQLRDKIKILRTLVSVAFITEPARTGYDKMVARIGDVSNDRNMVAHDLFFPHHEGDGIEFLVTKATGKVQFPKHQWSVDDVEARCEELRLIAGKLKELKPLFQQSDIIKALINQKSDSGGLLSQQPIGGLFGLGLRDQESPPTPSGSGSLLPETTDAKSLENPEDHQE